MNHQTVGVVYSSSAVPEHILTWTKHLRNGGSPSFFFVRASVSSSGKGGIWAPRLSAVFRKLAPVFRVILSERAVVLGKGRVGYALAGTRPGTPPL
jgi:hypothetical protein